MHGVGGTLEVFGVVAGRLARWHLHQDEFDTITFTSSGTFAAYWVSAGAVAAVVRPQLPRRPHVRLAFTGAIRTFTTTQIVLVGIATHPL